MCWGVPHAGQNGHAARRTSCRAKWPFPPPKPCNDRLACRPGARAPAFALLGALARNARSLCPAPQNPIHPTTHFARRHQRLPSSEPASISLKMRRVSSGGCVLRYLYCFFARRICVLSHTCTEFRRRLDTRTLVHLASRGCAVNQWPHAAAAHKPCVQHRIDWSSQQTRAFTHRLVACSRVMETAGGNARTTVISAAVVSSA